MNQAVHAEGQPRSADLAALPDFRLGLALVSPSSRTISGPAHSAVVEPRVMQVLAALAECSGRVVSRETLFNRCWADVHVGDDSLNRTVGAIRKLADQVADGSFKIETIPKVGYRLTGEIQPVGARARPSHGPNTAISRRTAIVGGVSVVGLAAGTAALRWSSSRREESHFATLMAAAETGLRKQTADQGTLRLAEQAVLMKPDDAKALGVFALLGAYLSTDAQDVEKNRLVDGSEEAARRALALDGRQPDALLAMLLLQGSTLDWFTRDRRLRDILSIDPNYLMALIELAWFTAAAGMARESWQLNERALAQEPLSPSLLGARALKLWVSGRISEADKVSDQLRALHPDDGFAWFVRMQIFAFTGRVKAATGMLISQPPAPPMAKLLQGSLPALASPSAANVSHAREAALQTTGMTGMAANEAILFMSALGQLDTAFDIAAGSLLSSGRLIPRDPPGTGQTAADANWRVNTQWMWAPPVAAMRSDPRFMPLCRDIGLADYWKKRGVSPDFMVARPS